MERTETQKKILEVGKREFLEKGYQGASMRAVVKEAGFTQGAFYGYYESKEALFDALVSEAADGLVERFKAAQEAHFALIPQGRTADSRRLSRSTCGFSLTISTIGLTPSSSSSAVLPGRGMKTTSMSWWSWRSSRRSVTTGSWSGRAG